MRTIVGEEIPGHPELHMWTRADGTRAALKGTRIEVIHVVREVLDGNEVEAAEWFDLDVAQVHAVMNYYRDHQALVDGWIRELDAFNTREYERWRLGMGRDVVGT